MNPIRPHGAWFLLAPAFFFGGIGVAVALIAMTASTIDTNRNTIAVSTGSLIHVKQPGAQSIYFEETGTTQARVPAGLTVTIKPEAGGEALPIKPATMNSTYHMNGKAGIYYGDVEFPSAGSYFVKSELPEGATAPNGGSVVVGGSPVAGVLGAVFGSFAAVGIGFVLAVIAAVVVAVKRSGSRKRQMAQYPPMQYPPTGPPGQWPPPPGGAVGGR